MREGHGGRKFKDRDCCTCFRGKVLDCRFFQGCRIRYIRWPRLSAGEEEHVLSEAPVPRRIAVRPVNWILFIMAEGGALPFIERI